MTVQKKALVAAAKEMNKIMGLEPRINVKADPEEIAKKILEAAEFIQEDDEFSQATLDVLEALKAEYEGAGDVDEDENGDENDVEDIEEEPEHAPKKSKADAGKGKGKGKTENKPNKKDNGKDAPFVDPAPGKGANPVHLGGPRKFGETFTRAMASGVVMAAAKAPISIADITKQADALYVKKTKNNSNMKEARWATGVALQALIGYGVVEYKDGLLFNKAN